MVGDDGRVRVMDFGLARADRETGGGRAGAVGHSALSIELTAIGSIMGTPAYMAPEQLLGRVADERTDEFSLGVTAWEALFGRKPFPGETFAALREAVTSGAIQPPPANAEAPVWLRRILARALEVDPRRRFESVRVMLDAIESREQQARGRMVIAGLTLGLVTLGALGVLLLLQWRASAANEARATRSEADARELVAKLELEQRASTEALSVQRGLRAKMLIPENREAEALQLAVLAVGAYGPGWDPPPPREAVDGLEQVLTRDAAIIERAVTLRGHEGDVLALAYSPSGAALATASRDATARIWDARTGAPRATLRGHADAIRAVAFSPDGERLATASRDGTAMLWSARSGEPLATLRGHEGELFALAFSPDGARLATAGADRSARVWDAGTGAPVASHVGHADAVHALSFAPDGEHVATASHDGTARVWDAGTGALVAALRGHESEVNEVVFSPDGARVATASYDDTARVWDPETGELVLSLHGHENSVLALAYSPDGRRLATGSVDTAARIWDAETGDRLATLHGHEGMVLALAYSPYSRERATHP